MAAIKADWLTKTRRTAPAAQGGAPPRRRRRRRPRRASRRRPDAPGAPARTAAWAAGGAPSAAPPGRAAWGRPPVAVVASGHALPDHHLRRLLPRRLRAELAADAAPPAVEVVHHRGQLRVLRLVGLALRAAAGGRHRREPGAGGADLARARPQSGGARRQGLAHPGGGRRTSACSATSSTSTSSP